MCGGSWAAAGGAQEPPAGPDVLARFLAANEHSLLSYEATRTLEVVARGGKMTALLTARTSLDVDKGFSFQVIDESGSGFLRSRVLHPVLEAEQEAKRRERGRAGALTAANYEFAVDAMTSDGLLRVGIKAKRKEELLMDGSILLTADTADLVQMEGLLVKRPSFWTRKVRIVRRYGRIARRARAARDILHRRHPVRRPVQLHDALQVRIHQRRGRRRRLPACAYRPSLTSRA